MRNSGAVLVALLSLSLGACASGGKLKVQGPDNPSNIPDDTPENFLKRYDHFIFKEERKPIQQINKQLKELAKRQATDDEKKAAVGRTGKTDQSVLGQTGQ